MSEAHLHSNSADYKNNWYYIVMRSKNSVWTYSRSRCIDRNAQNVAAKKCKTQGIPQDMCLHLSDALSSLNSSPALRCTPYYVRHRLLRNVMLYLPLCRRFYLPPYPSNADFDQRCNEMLSAPVRQPIHQFKDRKAEVTVTPSLCAHLDKHQPQSYNRSTVRRDPLTSIVYT